MTEQQFQQQAQADNLLFGGVWVFRTTWECVNDETGEQQRGGTNNDLQIDGIFDTTPRLNQKGQVTGYEIKGWQSGYPDINYDDTPLHACDPGYTYVEGSTVVPDEPAEVLQVTFKQCCPQGIEKEYGTVYAFGGTPNSAYPIFRGRKLGFEEPPEE